MFKKLMLVALCVAMLVPAQPARADGPVVLGLGRLTSIAVSPDGARLAVGTAIGVYFYDALTFAPQGFWDTGYVVNFLRWSPRGDVMAVVHDYGQVDFRSLADGGVLWSTTVPYQGAVEFSSGGARVIVSTYTKDANVFDAATGAPIGAVVDDLISMPDWYTSISPNRQWQATSNYSSNCNISLKALGGVKSARYTLRDPNGDTNCIPHIFAWSPDSLTLYSAGSSTVYAWDVQTGQPLRQLNGFSGRVTAVTWSADGRSVISYQGNNLVVSDVASRMPVHAIQTKQSVSDLLIAPWGDLVMENSAGSLIFYDATTLTEKQSYSTGRDVQSFTLSPNGQYLAVSGYGPFINIRDAVTGRALFDLKASTSAGHVMALAFSADSQTLFAMESSGLLWRWDLTTHTSITIQTEGPHVEWWWDFNGAVHAAANLAIVSGRNGTVVVNATTGALLYPLDGRANHLVINSQGTRLASFGWNSIGIWDLTSGALVATYTGHTDWVNDLAFNPAGDSLASGSDDGTIRIWPVP